MRDSRFIIIVLTILFVLGCREEKEETLLVSRTYNAFIEDEESETKLYLENKVFFWTADDRISIFEGKTSNNQFKFDGNNGDRLGTFSTVSGTPAGEDLTANYAYYPYEAGTTISTSGELSVTIPTTQYHFPGNKNSMVAVTTSVSDNTLNFKNVCGYLKLNIEGEASFKIRTITITGNSGEIISGPATITPSATADPTIEMSPSGESSITLDCDTPGVALMGSTPVSFYLMIPPTVFSSGFKIRITDTEGRFIEKTSTKVQTIQRNTLLNMPAFKYENPYTPISSIRSLYSGTDVTISSGVRIKGSVISNFGTDVINGLYNFTSQKTMIVSDGEAGLLLYLTENNTQFMRGDEVDINLSNQSLTLYNKVLEINGLPNANITKTGEAPLEPIPVTLDELSEGQYECMYVSLPNVQIAESDIGRTFVESNSNGNNVQTSINFVTSSNQSFVLFSGAYFYDGTTTVVPSGSGTLNGIYMTYKGSIKQMVITSLSDYAGLTGERFTPGGSGGSVPDWITPDRVNSWMELPVVTMSSTAAYVSHHTTVDGNSVRNYSMLYDGDYKLALWVAYPVCSTYTGSESRTDNFIFDPKVPYSKQADVRNGTYGTYATDECDRGHQLSSASRNATAEMNAATFYVTNMTPQHKYLNQRVWKYLEEKERDYASECDTLYVVTGPILATTADPVITYIKDKTNADVAKPKRYFKVFLKYTKSTETYSAIGFLYNNEAYASNYYVNQSDAYNVAYIETQTGFSFFSNLPASIRTTVKNTFNPSDWGFSSE